MSAEQLKETQTYKDEQAKYGTGSDIQRGIQAATAALQGLAGGDIAGALAGASAPELANLIGHGSGLSDGAAVVAHAILGGAVAALQGNSAAAGAEVPSSHGGMLEAVASRVGAAASDCGAVSGACEVSLGEESPLIPPLESELAFEAVVPESTLVRNARAIKKPPTPRTRATAATSAMTIIVILSPRATLFSAFISILSLCRVCA